MGKAGFRLATVTTHERHNFLNSAILDKFKDTKEVADIFLQSIFQKETFQKHQNWSSALVALTAS